MKDDARRRAAWLADAILPHEPWVRRQLRRGNTLGYEIDDIVQEAYARLIMLDSVAHITNPRAYFLQVARSLILQYLRRARVVPIDLASDIDAIDEAANEPLPDRQVQGQQELDRLMNAISTLPPRCQEVYRLRKIEGLSQRQVAERLMISESNVEKHLGRGVERIMLLYSNDQRSHSNDPKMSPDGHACKAHKR
ncbi:sigma-70 family RNA polymerase sigma factor [Novosphingobium sp. SG707]|uniref:sigma-70 family RNA polymerase sigma factor n=1 Tax=Novosphingobium sp. SG707 TaxID=2586996 RepID=UPI001446C364|nr:sigma-70 family RNA polymerase sigma factor [Novosphingobium sp. SG707]NKJ02937.1 RNA polymerase sigma-70 factor (ECF subfamily) [Novosphingobium sp. SG707]